MCSVYILTQKLAIIPLQQKVIFVSFNAVKRIQELFFICGALHDLVPFVQFKKREKHPWRNVDFSKVAGFKLYSVISFLSFADFDSLFYLTENLQSISLLLL